MSNLWGEFEQEREAIEDHISSETKMRYVRESLHKSPYRILPPSHNHNEKSELEMLSNETIGLAIDERILHSVRLTQYAKDMRNLINSTEDNTDSQILPPPTEIPDSCIPPFKHNVKHPLMFMDKNLSDFSQGIGEELPRITNFTAKQLLNKSIALLLVHTGFDTSFNSALSTYSDVVENYIKGMVTLLRKAVDEGANSGSTGFPDAIERVFYEMGIGSVHELHKYYHEQVVKRHEMIQDECRDLNLEYCTVSLHTKQDTLNLDDIVKEEEHDDVPEIHFPAVEDGIDELQPSLEPGFQMLHSLEQQVQSQLLDCQDDANIESVSPAQDSYETNSQKRKRLRI